MATSVVSAVKNQSKLVETAPEYWDQACRDLMKQDRILKKIIPKYGSGFLVTRGDAFTTLARAIVGQQISVAAAQAVWDRVVLASKKKINPKNILALSVQELRDAGLSSRKVEYIRDLADHFDSGRLHANQWQEMDDESVIKELSSIRGIGRWTAEMTLMFSLGREDVFSPDDYGIQQSMISVYGLKGFDKKPLREKMLKISERWAPYRTYACLHLWRARDTSK